MRFWDLISHTRAHSSAPLDKTKPVQSTSMFRNLSVALLAGASFLCARIDSAAAFDASVPEPTVIYANQAQPVRTAYAERSNMGGGFIEFLFGGGADRGQPYPQEPVYQQQPSYGPQGLLPPMQGPQQYQQD